MTNSYHNTTRESKEKAAQFEENAVTQEDKILGVFDKIHPELLSASMLFKDYFDCTIPITSIRRALSNLYHQGYITKTNHKQQGMYGRPEVLWKIK